jgi:amidase/6-aminohexanoate-cyclic-dimer hydrolase
MALTADTQKMGEAVAGFAPHCAVFNHTGAPAMSVPLHWTAPTATAPAGLPIGMMFGARYGQEGLLLALAGQLERAAPWAHRKPPACGSRPNCQMRSRSRIAIARCVR